MLALAFFALGVGVAVLGDDSKTRLESFYVRVGGLLVVLISGSHLIAKLQCAQ
ncbi:MAG: hypothetical protein ACOY6K_22345 [Pseudomonadota bacterium]|jgi:hypothetical protein